MKGESISPDRDPRIILIVVYFGAWPAWFPAYLASCRANLTIDWLFLTDCEEPPHSPENVRYIQTTLDQIRDLFSTELSLKISLPGNRKLCDLRPTYGLVLNSYISSYDFWGFCDIDIIWGDIRKFYTRELLDSYDVISARKSRLSGHFSLLKNKSEINEAFWRHRDLETIMSSPAYCWFDEVGFSDLLETDAGLLGIRVLWDRYRVNFVRSVDDMPSVLSWFDKYLWEGGRLYSLSEGSGEIMYLHFMNWKDSLEFCDVAHGDNPKAFTISYMAIASPGRLIPKIYVFRSFLKTLLIPKYYFLGFARLFGRFFRKYQ